jgi:hypothetical protein
MQEEVTMNAQGRKDVAATGLTALAVLTFFATHEGWNVYLVGDSRRWAAGVIVALGVAGCALGRPAESTRTALLMGLGTLALVLSVAALWTGSLTVLSLLVVDIVLLWAGSTLGHVQSGHRRPVTP